MSTDNAASLPLKSIARALDGVVMGDQVLAPGPSHSARDRSLSVRLSPSSPDGFLAFSHAGDDWRACRDHVRARLGLGSGYAPRRPLQARRPRPESRPEDDDREEKIASALALWRGSADPRGTVVETYLRSRGLDLGDDIAGEVLRWNARLGAMIALFRNIETDAPQAIGRTYLNREGRKLNRKFLGPVAGAAVKLDADEDVLGGLHIGEGVETCMAARQMGFRPAWALGSAGAVGRFPVLDGIEALTILAENDEANARAAAQVAERWTGAGHEVLIVRSVEESDLNDALKRRATA
jgi:putative DNA primase/helicase